MLIFYRTILKTIITEEMRSTEGKLDSVALAMDTDIDFHALFQAHTSMFIRVQTSKIISWISAHNVELYPTVIAPKAAIWTKAEHV